MELVVDIKLEDGVKTVVSSADIPLGNSQSGTVFS
jgi:hypothetical protein